MKIFQSAGLIGKRRKSLGTRNPAAGRGPGWSCSPFVALNAHAVIGESQAITELTQCGRDTMGTQTCVAE